jgi:hypothetical protein
MMWQSSGPTVLRNELKKKGERRGTAAGRYEYAFAILWVVGTSFIIWIAVRIKRIQIDGAPYLLSILNCLCWSDRLPKSAFLSTRIQLGILTGELLSDD